MDTTSKCAEACADVPCPGPGVVRRALPSCIVGDLRIVTNFLQAKCGAIRAKTRQELLDQIEQRIAMCERLGIALFTRRGVECMHNTSSLRDLAKNVLKIRHIPAHYFSRPSAARITPIKFGTGGNMLMQPTLTDLVSRQISGVRLYNATPPLTMQGASKKIPFYDMFDDDALATEISVKFGVSYEMDVFKVCIDAHTYGGGEGDWRVLLCFVSENTSATKKQLGARVLAWPPSTATVSLDGKLLARRGTDALPVDVTDLVRDTDCKLSVESKSVVEGTTLLGIHAMVIVCRFDTASAGGDAEHYLLHHNVREVCLPTRSGEDGWIEDSGVCVSLKCPFTMDRIRVPARTENCKHAQCFDLGALFMANAYTEVPKWQCPICKTSATEDELIVDPVVAHAIKTTDTSVDRIVLNNTHTMWHAYLEQGPWKEPELDVFGHYFIGEELVHDMGGSAAADQYIVVDTVPQEAVAVPPEDPEQRKEREKLCLEFWSVEPVGEVSETEAAVLGQECIDFWKPDPVCTVCRRPFVVDKGDADCAYETDGICMFCQMQ